MNPTHAAEIAAAAAGLVVGVLLTLAAVELLAWRDERRKLRRLAMPRQSGPLKTLHP